MMLISTFFVGRRHTRLKGLVQWLHAQFIEVFCFIRLSQWCYKNVVRYFLLSNGVCARDRRLPDGWRSTQYLILHASLRFGRRAFYNFLNLFDKIIFHPESEWRLITYILSFFYNRRLSKQRKQHLPVTTFKDVTNCCKRVDLEILHQKVGFIGFCVYHRVQPVSAAGIRYRYGL